MIYESGNFAEEQTEGGQLSGHEFLEAALREGHIKFLTVRNLISEAARMTKTMDSETRTSGLAPEQGAAAFGARLKTGWFSRG